jgi:paraquat-inducible protein A
VFFSLRPVRIQARRNPGNASLHGEFHLPRAFTLTYDEIIIPEVYPAKARLLRLYIWIASILLIIGLLAPIITLSRFVLIQNTFSVFSGVIELFKEGQIFLFLVITGFSIVLPILKLIVLYRLVSINAAAQEKIKKLLHWMHLYGKWSMLDVFVVAVLVVAVKLGAIADVEMHYGLYAFAASVLLTMVITAQIVALTNHPGQHTDARD